MNICKKHCLHILASFGSFVTAFAQTSVSPTYEVYLTNGVSHFPDPDGDGNTEDGKAETEFVQDYEHYGQVSEDELMETGFSVQYPIPDSAFIDDSWDDSGAYSDVAAIAIRTDQLEGGPPS